MDKNVTDHRIYHASPRVMEDIQSERGHCAELLILKPKNTLRSNQQKETNHKEISRVRCACLGTLNAARTDIFYLYQYPVLFYEELYAKCVFSGGL